MARRLALSAGFAVLLLAVAGAGGAATQQTPKRGGTVVTGAIGGEPACLNLYLPACAGGALVSFMDYLPAAVLSGAFEIGPDLTWRPKLVSRVDLTRKPPYTLTYRIRPGARWSDGVPISARDFVFTFETLRRAADSLEEILRSDVERIRSVTAVDETTVRVLLTARFAAWRRLFFALLPRHALRGETFLRVWKNQIDNPKTGEPIGSGPFIVHSWERTRRLTLVRNPRYSGPHPAYLERLVFRFGPLPEPAEAFPKGAVDYAWGFPPDAQAVSYLRRIPGINVLSAPASQLEHFDIRVGSGGHPALRLKLVRRALAYGIDREQIVRTLFGEITPLPKVANNALFLNGARHYEPNWIGYRYRPAEARRLLEQAGCRRGDDGIYSCAEQRLSLRFFTRGDFTRRVRTVELVQAQLKRAGVEVRPSYASGSVLFNQILPSGDYDLMLYSLVGAPPDEFGAARWGCGGAVNFLGYCQRLVTADLDQADRILDDAQRARVLNRADARLARDVPVIPLYWSPTVVAVRSTLRGFVVHPNDPLWKPEDWWLAASR